MPLAGGALRLPGFGHCTGGITFARGVENLIITITITIIITIIIVWPSPPYGTGIILLLGYREVAPACLIWLTIHIPPPKKVRGTGRVKRKKKLPATPTPLPTPHERKKARLKRWNK
ncbi:hypothetical protein C7212DRAFT_322368 [Tuber magnatum]|uniref:Uncharacterized protein n=1 Tax=Tuber magnatum TaxID=42249 RepID=A0A317SPD3_9PEZI|nr:hypothetical protein C7212DRAFT_322368 [Tuber magnatum]